MCPYIVSMEIYRHRKRHGRSPTECPLDCKPLLLFSLTVLKWCLFMGKCGSKKESRGVRTVGRLGNRWNLEIGQEAHHQEVGVSWRVVMVTFPILHDVRSDAINPSYGSLEHLHVGFGVDGCTIWYKLMRTTILLKNPMNMGLTFDSFWPSWREETPSCATRHFAFFVSGLCWNT